jgi:hypothetical protein
MISFKARFVSLFSEFQVPSLGPAMELMFKNANVITAVTACWALSVISSISLNL